MGMKQKKIQNDRLKHLSNLSFSTSPKAEQFPPKFNGLVLGFVGLIDAKGIDLAQPIWSSGSFPQLMNPLSPQKKHCLWTAPKEGTELLPVIST
jgi:hypothetical protein